MTSIIIDLCTCNKTEELKNKLMDDVEECTTCGLCALAVAYGKVEGDDHEAEGNRFELISLVRVQRLMDGGNVWLSVSQGYTIITMRLDSIECMMGKQLLDDSCLYCEFNPVKGDEPNNILWMKSDYITIKPFEKNTYPDPDDTDPTTRDRSNIGKAPVTMGSDDWLDELSNTEGTEEHIWRTLHVEESMWTSDKDQSLWDDCDLEVDFHVQLFVIVINGLTG